MVIKKMAIVAILILSAISVVGFLKFNFTDSDIFVKNLKGDWVHIDDL